MSTDHPAPLDVADRSTGWFLPLLAATTIGVYLLVVVGSATALTDGAASCSTWPTCDGRWIVLDGGTATIAWGHRLGSLIVGIGLFATGVLAWFRHPSRRIRTMMVFVIGLYLVQISIGAATALSGGSVLVSGFHLFVGMSIFGLLVLLLSSTLDHEYGLTTDRDATQPTPPPESKPRRYGTQTGMKAVIMAYLSLTKPRLMWLLCLVAVAAMALAAGPALSSSLVVATLVGGVLAIGASGTFNNVLERDLDRRMRRTADRPVATQTIPVNRALLFGIGLTIASLSVFYWAVNPLVAVLGATAIVFYSVIYTLVLKPNTVQNTVIGGIAGALPAFIGWAAVTESLGIPAVLLATVIFLWTPAHFYNLALAYKADYIKAGIPMLPVIRGDRITRTHIIRYLGATLLAAAALATVDTLHLTYAMTVIVLGTLFLLTVIHLHREQTDRAALRSFHASNVFLGGVLLAIIVDALIF